MSQVQKDSSAWSAINTTVWDIVNPITNIGAQFFGGPFSYPTYWRMATKGVANVDPFFLSRFLSFIPKSIYNNTINPGLKYMNWDKGVKTAFNVTKSFIEKIKIPYVYYDKNYGIVINNHEKMEKRLRNKIKIQEERLKKYSIGKETRKKFINKNKKELIKLASKGILSKGIIALGWIGLAYTTYDIVKTTGEVLNFLHEQSINLAQDIEARRQHMLKVDFNKPLYGGYLTAGAYTERQRAIRLLARNPGLPRPAIGNEAYRYSGGY